MHVLLLTIKIDYYIGEFGLVYKAHLFDKDGIPQDVAVKTLKGMCQSMLHKCTIRAISECTCPRGLAACILIFYIISPACTL